MYLVEIITETEYWTAVSPFDDPGCAEACARGMRSQLAGVPGFVAVRVINLAFATRW